MNQAEPRPDVVSTYRMLRLALAAMAGAILLGAAVQTASQGCLLHSISAYWYTPATTVFVAGLVVIGICLVALRGGTWTENFLLNLAGLFAPIVAIVPVPLTREADFECLVPDDAGYFAFVAPSATGIVDNGLIAYFSIAALAYLVAVVSSTRRARLVGPVPFAVGVARLAGLAVSLLALLGLGAWRLLDDESFYARAHTTSAIAMFVCVGLVIAFRTRPLAQVSRRWDGYRDDSVDRALTGRRAAAYSRAYGVIASVMLVAVVVGFVLARAWEYRVIAVETTLLVSFIVFWLLQASQLAGVDEPG